MCTGGFPHLSGLSHPPGVPHLLSYRFVWILRDAKRSLPIITPVSVFMTKLWPETSLLVSGFNDKKKRKIGEGWTSPLQFFSSLRARSPWRSGGGAGGKEEGLATTSLKFEYLHRKVGADWRR